MRDKCTVARLSPHVNAVAAPSISLSGQTKIKCVLRHGREKKLCGEYNLIYLAMACACLRWAQGRLTATRFNLEAPQLDQYDLFRATIDGWWRVTQRLRNAHLWIPRYVCVTFCHCPISFTLDNPIISDSDLFGAPPLIELPLRFNQLIISEAHFWLSAQEFLLLRIDLQHVNILEGYTKRYLVYQIKKGFTFYFRIIFQVFVNIKLYQGIVFYKFFVLWLFILNFCFMYDLGLLITKLCLNWDLSILGYINYKKNENFLFCFWSYQAIVQIFGKSDNHKSFSHNH